MDRYKIKNINKEEKDLLDSMEKIDTRTLKKPTAKEQKLFKIAANQFIEKETKMNIRINPIELNKIKEKAKKEGLRYSTLVKSVMHKYITGQLVEKNRKAGSPIRPPVSRQKSIPEPKTDKVKSSLAKM